MKRYRVVVVLSAVAALLAFAGPAGADPTKPEPTPAVPGDPVPGGFKSWGDLAQSQDQLDAAAQRLDAGAHGQDGFTGIQAAPESRRLRLFWTGAVPDSVAQLVDQIRQTVPVEVVPAPHTEAELLRQRDAIAAEQGVGEVAPSIDGTHLTVRYQGSEDKARSLPSIARSPVPVVVIANDEPQPLSCTGRPDDCTPYWGGSQYVAGGGCSTGFAMKFTNIFSPGTSTYKMLSAGHCGSNGNAVVDGGGDPFGTVTNKDAADDLLLLSPNSSVTVAPRVYTGPWNAGISNNMTVVGTATNFVGDWVCTSGSYTGEHCALHVVALNVLRNVNGFLVPMVQVAAASGVAAGHGDSGGPVFSFSCPCVSSGVFLFFTRVRARGTISYGESGTETPCPSGSPSGGCYSTIDYVDIARALSSYSSLFVSAQVLTG